MRPARLILLAVVVLGLGAFIYFFERTQPTTDERAERKDRVFPAFETEDARKVVITNSHGRFELVKAKEDWRLVAPLADDANTGAVTGLLSTLASLKSERSLPAGEVKLSDYGLAEPKLSLVIEGEGGTALAALKLGEELPLGGQRAALEGSTVHFVSKWIADDVDRDLAAWRSTSLAKVLSSEVAALTVKAGAGRVALAHSGGTWRLTEPIADLAGREAAEALVGDVNSAQIREHVDQPGDLAALGLAAPRIELTFVVKDSEPLQLAFGAEREVAGARQVACRRGERVLWVEARAIEHATADLAAWRSRSLVALDTWAAKTLEVEAAGTEATLEREDGTWKAGSTEVDQMEVSERLRTLADLQVAAFERPAPTGAVLGRVKVTLEDDKASPVEATFHAGDSEGEAVAVVAGRAGALAVDRAKVAELLSDPAALARPKPTPTEAPTAAPATPQSHGG